MSGGGAGELQKYRQGAPEILRVAARGENAAQHPPRGRQGVCRCGTVALRHEVLPGLLVC